MCGIFGQVNQSLEVNYNACVDATNLLSHRGPDSSGYWIDDSKRLFLGHRRLSIVDLSPSANQPFFLNDNLIIIYNGEIYNYQELRKSYLNHHNFKSNSDTEVLIVGYEKYGIGFFKEIRGIYAFAILDRRNGTKLLLYRDPSGVKPLYYYYDKERLIFSSEIKSIIKSEDGVRRINDKVVYAYIHLGYCPEPETAFRGILTIEPGVCYTFGEECVQKKKLVDYRFTTTNKNIDYKYLEDLLTQAVNRNKVADVPVSFALSSGIDSSLLTAIASSSNRDIKALSVRFKVDKFDETKLSTQYARYLQVDHNIIDIGVDFNLSILDMLLNQFDQPYADSSLVPTYYLAKVAREYTKVLIGGDGGDEVFNGYPSMHRLYFLFNDPYVRYFIKKLNLFQFFLNKDRKRQLHKIIVMASSQLKEALFIRSSWFPHYLRWHNKSPYLFNIDIGLQYYLNAYKLDGRASPDEIILNDYFRKTLLSDYLKKTDMMTMLNSLEYRVPFLDEDLLQYSFSIPFSKKSSLFQSKIILRKIHESFYDGLGNKQHKRGFAIPLERYLSKKEKTIISETLMDSRVREFVDITYVQYLLGQFENYTDPKFGSYSSIYQRVLILYSLALWFNNNRF